MGCRCVGNLRTITSLWTKSKKRERFGTVAHNAEARIKIAAQCANIVGADINELSPIKGFDSYNFLVAKLAYKIIAYSFEFKNKSK